MAGGARTYAAYHGVLLYRQYPPERGQTGRGVQYQERASRGVEYIGARLRDEPGGRDRTRSLANRYLYRRLALQPGDFRKPPVQDAPVDDSPSGRCRQQERQPAAEHPAARTWQARRR